MYKILFGHAAARGGTCASTLKIVNTLINNCSRDDRPLISTYNQPTANRFVSGKATVNVDDTPEYIRWIRRLGGEKLPAASYALLPNLKKGLFFAIGEGSRFCRLFSTQRQNVLVSDAWPAPATYNRPFCEHCCAWCPWSRVGRCLGTCRGCVCSLAAVLWLAPAY